MEEIVNIKDIQKARLIAMKASDKSKAMTLSLLSSTAQRIAKDDGNREPTNSDVIAAAQRLIKQTTETLSFLDDEGARQSLRNEIAVYEDFLPEQLSDEKLRWVINEEIMCHDTPTMKDMGRIQQYLKSNYEGRYNPKAVSNIIKELAG